MKKMKIANLFVSSILFIAFSSLSNFCFSQNIGINGTGAAPNSKAILDIDVAGMSQMRGLLIPRLSTVERATISGTIPDALLIFNTDLQCFQAYSDQSLTWVSFGCLDCQLPGGFAATAATNITASTFSVNWQTSIGATAYYLDVATNANFTSIVAGFGNLNVSNVNTYSVTGLVASTTYYFRIRASNACGTSTNTNVISAVTSN